VAAMSQPLKSITAKVNISPPLSDQNPLLVVCTEVHAHVSNGIKPLQRFLMKTRNCNGLIHEPQLQGLAAYSQSGL
ncbi:MAG TPA: hypothetical protein V6D34_07050, partial [Candidatus Sericytochromatia bacterium]